MDIGQSSGKKRKKTVVQCTWLQERGKWVPWAQFSQLSCWPHTEKGLVYSHTERWGQKFSGKQMANSWTSYTKSILHIILYQHYGENICANVAFRMYFCPYLRVVHVGCLSNALVVGQLDSDIQAGCDWRGISRDALKTMQLLCKNGASDLQGQPLPVIKLTLVTDRPFETRIMYILPVSG